MTPPIVCTVIAGVAIAAVLFFIFGEQPQPAYNYEHRPSPQRPQRPQRPQPPQPPQPSSSRQRRRRQPDFDDVCSICLEPFVRGNCYVLDCRHAFHMECIQKLQKSYNINARCPLCRSKIPRIL